MRKLWKRDQKYYFFVVIMILVMTIFVAEKINIGMTKHVLQWFTFEEKYESKYVKFFAKTIVEGDKSIEDSIYYWFSESVETSYEKHYWEDKNKEEFYVSSYQGSEMFSGKLSEAYCQSVKEAKVQNLDLLSDQEQGHVKKIFEKKVNQIYKEVSGKTIEEDYLTIMDTYTKDWEEEEYTKLGELLNNYPNLYERMIDELFDRASILGGNQFGYEEQIGVLYDDINTEYIAIILFTIFVFLVQLFKWKYFNNHEFEITLPISKKTKTIYELLTGIGMITIPCLYFWVKGILWQIQYSEVGFYGAMNQNLILYVMKKLLFLFILMVTLYLAFYLFKQMSHSIVFASVLYMVLGFPLLSYSMYQAPWSVTVIGGLLTSILLFGLIIWIGIREEGSNTKLFKYKSFQVIVNLYLIGCVFGYLLYGFIYSTEEMLLGIVSSVCVLALIVMINLWIYRYDYKQAK